MRAKTKELPQQLITHLDDQLSESNSRQPIAWEMGEAGMKIEQYEKRGGEIWVVISDKAN